MQPEPPEIPRFPHIEVLPLVDRIVNAGLWIGRLFTKQVIHPPIEISDHFPKERYDTFDIGPPPDEVA